MCTSPPSMSSPLSQRKCDVMWSLSWTNLRRHTRKSLGITLPFLVSRRQLSSDQSWDSSSDDPHSDILLPANLRESTQPQIQHVFVFDFGSVRVLIKSEVLLIFFRKRVLYHQWSCRLDVSFLRSTSGGFRSSDHSVCQHVSPSSKLPTGLFGGNKTSAGSREPLCFFIPDIHSDLFSKTNLLNNSVSPIKKVYY